MEYENEKLVMQRKKMKESLIEAYIKARSIEEFLVEASLKYDDAPRNWIRAFKIYHFKKEHPIAWAAICMSMFMSLAVSVIFMLCFHALLAVCIFGFAFLLAFAFIMLHAEMHVEMMRSIEWHEHVCPIDY